MSHIAVTVCIYQNNVNHACIKQKCSYVTIHYCTAGLDIIQLAIVSVLYVKLKRSRWCLEWPHRVIYAADQLLSVAIYKQYNNQVTNHNYIAMWPDLRKAPFHAHNTKTHHFSPSNDSCTHWLTIETGIYDESCPGCFCCGLFLRLSRCCLQMPPYSPWQVRRQPTVIHHMTQWAADEFGHGFSCYVWYVEVKTAPMDAIWLFLVKT